MGSPNFSNFFFFFGNAPNFSNLAYQDNNNVEIQAGVTSHRQIALLSLFIIITKKKRSLIEANDMGHFTYITLLQNSIPNQII